MQDKLYIQTRLTTLASSFIPQSVEACMEHRIKLDTVAWVFNCGQIKTEQQVQNKLQRAKEELTTLELAGLNDKIAIKCAKAKVYELEAILK